MTGIEWTDQVWNPTTGCDRISAGCDHCYALTMARRLKGMGQAKYQNDGNAVTSGPGFGLTLHEDALTIPLHWREPRRVFVNSMSDLFHARVPFSFIADVFAVIADTPQHTYQVLTKRSLRLRRLAGKLDWPPNLWMGVSVEDGEHQYRIGHLLDTPAKVKFVSAEPLLSHVDLGVGDPHRRHRSDDLGSYQYICLDCSGEPSEDDVPYFTREPDSCGLDWVIIGGESGPGARPMSSRWARTLIQECRTANVSVFVKQLGSVLGRELGAGPKGGDWNAWPEDLRIREFPVAANEAAA